ncbi:kinesin motor domain-containing protein [Spinellus fusiger]|nr:kinesin motor domain-containing protein [Spinellus fusiger]
MQRSYEDYTPSTPTRPPPRTPQRNDRTPTHGLFRTHVGDRTPTRPLPRTPQRNDRTPVGARTPTRPVFKTPIKPPDFFKMTLDNEQRSAQNTTHRSTENFFAYNPEKELIKAYLRIRPLVTHQEEHEETPYLQIVDDLEVSMIPPETSNAYRTRNRAPERYKFTKIFSKSVTQQDFFNQTTLPLIKDVLNGANALVFAYGVTNSGKTYSIMGTRQHPGILPRTLDVIFNSTRHYLSPAKLKPVMHSLVQAYENVEEENKSLLETASMLDSHDSNSPSPDQWEGSLLSENKDLTVVSLQDKYEYGIWVSFAEIYTEKIYDLLVPPDRHLKRKALSLKYEFRSGHKYISGLKEVRVSSIQEAYTVLREGQRNRAVFSTLVNQTSSRSHSVFTIRIVRLPIDEEDYVIEDPAYATVSKMSIVDLAGSERHSNTFNSGQRLKEAGNINKSLMVLGQCMETLRLNQLKATMGKRQAVVPFRHSKLTELFKSSFEGDGKAVMVVNVNPFDTGFDENSHVMKFAAVAKDVATWRRVHPKLDLKGISSSVRKYKSGSKDQQDSAIEAVDMAATEDEDDDEDVDEDVDEDPFVDGLITQLEDLRNKWIDAETRCATMESTIRQQVAKEMQAELGKMENIYISTLERENNINGTKIMERMKNSESNEFLINLQGRQESLTTEITKLRAVVQDYDATRHHLLQKITDLERDKRREQETTQRLVQDLNNKEEEIKTLTNASCHSNHSMEEDNLFLERTPAQPASLPLKSQAPMQIEGSSQRIRDKAHVSSEVFAAFLNLRKRLRRSIFREQYSKSVDDIMTQVEQFKGVTFELVKETNMGKLLKQVAQTEFKDDHYSLQSRAKQLFKLYAQLSIPILTATKQKKNTRHRESMVVLSVDAGKEEDLISDMRVALDTLQDENYKLKTKLKFMQEGQRKLKQAFEKTRYLERGTTETVSEKARESSEPVSSPGEVNQTTGFFMSVTMLNCPF